MEVLVLERLDQLEEIHQQVLKREVIKLLSSGLSLNNYTVKSSKLFLFRKHDNN